MSCPDGECPGKPEGGIMPVRTTITFTHSKKITNDHLADALEIIAGEIRKKGKIKHQAANGSCQWEVS
jgi:hypothetical protein